jgi:lactate dehydrogenase-like 2-hydroxyacid dehydrogenase
VEKLLASEFEAELNPEDRPFSPAELERAMAEADVVCVTVTDDMNADVLLAPERRARLVVNFGVGFNHIDMEAARRAGIQVTNTPGVLTDCTADLAMTLLLMAARRAGEGERELRSGHWSGWRPTHLLGTKVSGKTLGIVGAGRIGTATARRAHFGFGMRILLTSRSPVETSLLEELQAQALELDELLQRADFVSLHCPSTPETRHLIDARRLALMGPEAMLINTARGDVVDEGALVTALGTGVIAAAGLDVYEREPQVAPALTGLENVVLLPHLGSATEETRTAMGMRALANLRAFAAGDPLPDLVS